MANVFESDWDVEIPEPWSLRFARVGHRAGSERLGATVYFHAVHGRLKLREQPPEPPHLIAYSRADGPAPRPSLYRIAEVADPAVLAATLADSLGVRVVVEKARRLLMWRNVRVHVERVAGLGDFVELEAVASTADGLDAERPRIDRLTDALGIHDALLVSDGYAEMLEARRPALGRAGARLTLRADA